MSYINERKLWNNLNLKYGTFRTAFISSRLLPRWNEKSIAELDSFIMQKNLVKFCIYSLFSLNANQMLSSLKCCVKEHLFHLASCLASTSLYHRL